MAAKNDVTGDSLTTKAPNKKYDEGWERIFGKKNKENIETVSDKRSDSKLKS